MKKQILAWMLILVMLLSACSGGQKTPVQSTDAGTTAPGNALDASLYGGKYLPVLQTLSTKAGARGLYHDLDGNGVPELLVRYIESETNKLEVWTLEQETPVQVAVKNMGPAREGAVSTVGTITKEERTYVVIRQEETTDTQTDEQVTILDYDGSGLEEVQNQRTHTEDGVTEYYIDELPVEKAEFDAVALPLDGEETLLSTEEDDSQSLADMVTEAGGEIPTEPADVPTEPVMVPTEPEQTVERVEQTYSKGNGNMPDCETILTGYDANGNAVWSWTSEPAKNDSQIGDLTEFAEDDQRVWVTVNGILYCLDRGTGALCWTAEGLQSAIKVVADGEGNCYVATFMGVSARGYDAQGNLFLDLDRDAPEVAEQLYWAYDIRCLGDGVIQVYFDGVTDETAAAALATPEPNEWGNTWYVLYDTVNHTVLSGGAAG